MKTVRLTVFITLQSIGESEYGKTGHSKILNFFEALLDHFEAQILFRASILDHITDQWRIQGGGGWGGCNPPLGRPKKKKKKKKEKKRKKERKKERKKNARWRETLSSANIVRRYSTHQVT